MTIFVKKPRRVLQWLWARFLAASGCLWWAKHQLRSDGAVVALMFHRVLSESSYQKTDSQPEIIVREQTFRKLVAYVAGHYETVDLQQATPGMASTKLRLAFTFDDGWGDNYSAAFPIVSAYRIPVVVFVCSGLVDRKTPFWPEQVIALLRAIQPPAEDTEITALIENLKKCAPEKREQHLAKLVKQASEQGSSLGPKSVDGTLSWQEIAEMDQAGIRFGSHTQTHQILTTIPADEARREVLECKSDMESALNKRCDVFSYPNGNWSPETRDILAEAGYKLAFTTEHGAWTATCDPLCIPRLNVYEENLVGPISRFSPAMFEYTTFWKAWRATKANSRLRVRAQRQPASATS